MTKRILVDMDGILADLSKTWLKIYNEDLSKYGYRMDYWEDIVDDIEYRLLTVPKLITA